MEERNKLLREMQLNRETVDIQAQMDEVVRERKYSKINEDEVVRYIPFALIFHHPPSSHFTLLALSIPVLV